jgi:Na+-translocating ferredoxin:NAD+ oxidoreductase subunit B
MSLILVAVISLGAIGLISAVILYVASKKFAVYEDPRIAQVAEVLPQANCGGCGFPGCSGFAAACVKAGSLEGKMCPVGGQPTMEKVASILGLEAAASEPKVAVVRCNGTCANRPKLTQYDGVRSCVVANSTFGGETGCTFGCLGCGDCVSACQFDAIHMNPETGLPEVDESKCTACGACSKACPRNIIEIRPKGKNNRRVYVQCVNKDKGAVARKIHSDKKRNEQHHKRENKSPHYSSHSQGCRSAYHDLAPYLTGETRLIVYIYQFLLRFSRTAMPFYAAGRTS